MTQDALSLAGLTTVVGMSVVFSALFLLSIYMIIFKRLLAAFEAHKRQKATPKEVSQTKAPDIEAAPCASGVPEAEVAAIALALHMEGARGEIDLADVAAIGLAMHLERLGAGSAVVPPDVAAVIMTALHLHMQSAQAANIAAALAPEPPKAGAGSWKMAGLAQSHAMRFQIQAQPRRIVAA
jgi:Na+-transporting methylmalonyl-CoA/oxaloacetate decarboxylase gamma subunit